MNQGFGLKAEQLFIGRDGCFKVLQCLQILHVSNVLADEGVLVAGDAEGVLQLRPTGEEGKGRIGELYGIGCISPRSTKRLSRSNGFIFLIRYLRDEPDTVIVTGLDLPVVEEKPVTQIAQSPPGLFVILCDRFL